MTRGVPFSKADGVPLSLDVYQPSAKGTFPIIMQIYGGSWQTGAPTNHEWFSRHFAERGYVVVAIDYRHAPEWKWPEQIVDVRTALYWISQDAGKFGGDPSRIVVVGRSAGAQLAMRLAYQEGPSSIRGVVNYYGPVDLAEGWRQPPQPDPANVRGILEMFIGGTPDQKPEHYRHASPITWVSKTVAPTLSLYGTRDHIVEARFGRMLDAALKKRRRHVRAARVAMVGAFVRCRAQWPGTADCAELYGAVYCVGGESLSCARTAAKIAAGSPDSPPPCAIAPFPPPLPPNRSIRFFSTPPASSDRSCERAHDDERGDSAVRSTAIVAGLAAIDDASFFRPFASQPDTADSDDVDGADSLG